LETFRCPTCLTVLADVSAKRCPACHTKLRKRARPIVLGESSRTGAKLTPFDLEMQARLASVTAPAVSPVVAAPPARLFRNAPTPVPAGTEHELVPLRSPELVAVFEPEPEPDPVLVTAPAPEPVLAIAPDPEPEPVPATEPVREASPLEGSLNEMLDELFRKARADSGD
jgi:hypothetical protein